MDAWFSAVRCVTLTHLTRTALWRPSSIKITTSAVHTGLRRRRKGEYVKNGRTHTHTHTRTYKRIHPDTHAPITRTHSIHTRTHMHGHAQMHVPHLDICGYAHTHSSQHISHTCTNTHTHAGEKVRAVGRRGENGKERREERRREERRGEKGNEERRE